MYKTGFCLRSLGIILMFIAPGFNHCIIPDPGTCNAWSYSTFDYFYLDFHGGDLCANSLVKWSFVFRVDLCFG